MIQRISWIHSAVLAALPGLGRETPGQKLCLPQRSSNSMSFSWLFLGGLVSTRARLGFTNREQHALTPFCWSSIFQRTANSLLTVRVGIELRRACCRWRVTVLALSIARWVHISTMATFPEAPL